MQLEKLSQELEKQYQAYRLQEANEQPARQTYEQDKKTILAQSETKKDEYRTALDTLCNHCTGGTYQDRLYLCRLAAGASIDHAGGRSGAESPVDGQ